MNSKTKLLSLLLCLVAAFTLCFATACLSDEDAEISDSTESTDSIDSTESGDASDSTGEVVTYTVTFANYDGTVLQSGEVAENETPVYEGATPTKEATAQYTYSFNGWTPEIAVVTGDATYTATYTETVNNYTVTFDTNGGNEIAAVSVPYGTASSALDEIIPNKTGYTFVKWQLQTGEDAYVDLDGTETVTENITVKAVWTATTYYATFKNGEETVGEPVAYTVETESITEPDVPAKEGYTGAWGTYDLTTVGGITVNAVYTPIVYTATIERVSGDDEEVEFTIENRAAVLAGITLTADTDEWAYSWVEDLPEVLALNNTQVFTETRAKQAYVITWKNDNGDTLETDAAVEYGVTPEYNGETPTKAADAQYTYTFDTWTPAVTAVTGDATYTATFTGTVNTYTVTWNDENGITLETDENVPYGTTPEYNGTTPAKEATAQYTYTFNAWSPAVTTVTGDVTYTATYTEDLRKYTVSFGNYSVPQEIEYQGTAERPDFVVGASVIKWKDESEEDFDFNTEIMRDYVLHPVTEDYFYSADFSTATKVEPESGIKITVSPVNYSTSATESAIVEDSDALNGKALKISTATGISSGVRISFENVNVSDYAHINLRVKTVNNTQSNYNALNYYFNGMEESTATVEGAYSIIDIKSVISSLSEIVIKRKNAIDSSIDLYIDYIDFVADEYAAYIGKDTKTAYRVEKYGDNANDVELMGMVNDSEAYGGVSFKAVLTGSNVATRGIKINFDNIDVSAYKHVYLRMRIVNAVNITNCTLRIGVNKEPIAGSTGHPYIDPKPLNSDDVWRHYFSYDLKESIYGDETTISSIYIARRNQAISAGGAIQLFIDHIDFVSEDIELDNVTSFTNGVTTVNATSGQKAIIDAGAQGKTWNSYIVGYDLDIYTGKYVFVGNFRVNDGAAGDRFITFNFNNIDVNEYEHIYLKVKCYNFSSEFPANCTVTLQVNGTTFITTPAVDWNANDYTTGRVYTGYEIIDLKEIEGLETLSSITLSRYQMVKGTNGIMLYVESIIFE